MSGDSLFGSLTITGVAYTGLDICRSTIVNGKIDKKRSRPLGTTSIATGATTTVATGYSVGLQTYNKTATAYIESLDDQQLATLVESLEKQENMMLEETDLDNSKQLIKKL